MGKFWNSIKCIILIGIIGIFGFQSFSFGDATNASDLLDQVFDKALEYEYVLEVGGRTSDQVGNEVLRGGITIQAGESWTYACLDPKTNSILYIYKDGKKFEIDNENECNIAGGEWHTDALDIEYKQPLVVKITKILLRITMVLAITMVILNSVKLMIEVLSGKVDLKSSGAKKNLVSIILGILIALFSVTIINLIISIPKSSVTTTSDISDNTLGCIYTENGENKSMNNNNLKKYICFNDNLGYNDNMSDREWGRVDPITHPNKYPMSKINDDGAKIGAYRCKVQKNGSDLWIRIKDELAKDLCISWGGNYGLN